MTSDGDEPTLWYAFRLAGNTPCLRSALALVSADLVLHSSNSALTLKANIPIRNRTPPLAMIVCPDLTRIESADCQTDGNEPSSNPEGGS